ncbi:capsular polysaccharide export protein, LipB/KpsS family [Selenomonas ruminantium]|uniref:Capsular polysaccharide export protein n=1 Tax=Selenomonas ruminantium TaxID=971 RepID=A0A1H0M8C9_SELRU|nr:hypothetical protein [Selenomonas ruminantium]SDO76360.1 capsular polysaccharide export protein [Selenomonas ruminantium]
MMNKVIIMLSTYKQAKFGARLAEVLHSMDCKVHFYTIQYSAYMFLKKHGFDTTIAKKKKVRFEKIHSVKFNDQVEVLSNRMNSDECACLYNVVFADLEQIEKKQPVDGIIIWNGLNVEHRAASNFARQYYKKVLFCEVSNLPGKLFVDKFGTNAKSEIYNNIQILDRYSDNVAEYNDWREKYLLYKERQIKVPQAKSRFTDLSFKVLLDVIGYFFVTHVGYNKKYIFKRFLGLVKNFGNNFQFDNYIYKKHQDEYVFLPLQVSYDTQVLINSDVTVDDSIKIAIDRAQKLNKKLVIKPHPQESDYQVINKLLGLRKNSNFILVNDNTFEIIKYAYEIITINSTVGLEAMIMNKNVKFLGRSFYAKMNGEQLRKYVMSYLINIDFFDDSEISINDVEKLLNRMEGNIEGSYNC